MMSVKADKLAIKPLALKAAKITVSSPTKPDVHGSAAFASAKNTIRVANLGIVVTIPP